MDASQKDDSESQQVLSAGEQARRLARAERVLGCVQHTLNHDLPNQLVAMQGLLQMLDLEEQNHLSGEGKDYLRRLLAISRRLQEMAAALKAVGRAALEGSALPEEVVLADAAQELAAAVKKLFPARDVTYRLQFGAPSVRAPRRALQHALAELVRATVHTAAPGPVVIEVRSRQTAAGVELCVGAVAEQSALAGTARRAEDLFRGAGGLGLALARELADAWGGALTAAPAPGGGHTFTLLIPPL